MLSGDSEILEIDGEPQPKPELYGMSFERYEFDGGNSGQGEVEGSSTQPQELDTEEDKAVGFPSRIDGG